MTDLIRCSDCNHCPGLGERCEVRPTVHASRHPRRCAHYQRNLPRLEIFCGDCRHRSPTGVCYVWTNANKELVRVDADLECSRCEAFEIRKRWAC
ncbi:MAG: hypothetical protein KDE45_00325 [Caldilineaceae bacterium]|nr:hypothetical protein [Caldilineaceae bacterium]